VPPSFLALKAKIICGFTSHTVALVTYFERKVITMHSPLVGQFFLVLIAALLEKE